MAEESLSSPSLASGWSASHVRLTALIVPFFIFAGCPAEEPEPDPFQAPPRPCEILKNCDAGMDPDPNPDPNPTPNPDVGMTDADMGDVSEPDPNPDADPNPDPNPDATPDPDPDAGPDFEPDATPDPQDADPDPNPEPDAGPDVEPDATPDPEDVPEPDPDAPTGCAFGDACPIGLVCDEQANECVECTGDQDCVGLRVCNVVDQVCVDCFSDIHCPGLSLCDEETNDCFERPSCEGEDCEERSLCTSSDDCEEGRFCTPDGCQDIAPECGQGRPCPQGQACFNGECELLGCQGDGDCSEGRRCHLDFGECVACREDVDCGELVCDAEVGRCIQCREDGDCPGNFTCDTLVGECLEPEGCQGDDDCLGERTCVPEEEGPNICVGPPCSPDRFEPNESLDTAAPLLLGDNEATICLADEDFYFFSVQAGEGFVVQIRYDVRASILQAELYDNNDELVEFVGDFDFLGFIQIARENVPENGDWKVRVQFLQGQDQDYTITSIPIPGGFCLNDGAEPSGTPEEASPLSVESVLSQLAKLCEADEDWYTVDLFEGQNYRAEAFGIERPVAIEIFEPDGVTRVLRDTSPRLTKTLPFEAGETGVYFVRIFPVDPESTTNYEVNINAQ